MGVVIYTNRPDRYTDNDTVYMEGRLRYPPTGQGVTYALSGTMSLKEAIDLAPSVGYRLVITPKNKPTFGSEGNVIVDWEERKENFNSIISGIYRFPQRDMLLKRLQKVPIPYLLASCSNIRDYRLWNLIAKANMVLPDEYVRALIAFGVKPHPKVAKSKGKKTKPTSHPLFRESDQYIDFIIRNSEEVANELRQVAPDLIPKGVKKTIQTGDSI